LDVEALVSHLDAIAPGFRVYAESTNNGFATDSVHGVLAACSHFVREQPVTDACWQRLAALANSTVGSGDHDLDEAMCTCFLENLAARDHPLDELLRGEALAYWRRWCDGV
jgi:hypothetical protein